MKPVTVYYLRCAAPKVGVFAERLILKKAEGEELLAGGIFKDAVMGGKDTQLDA